MKRICTVVAITLCIATVSHSQQFRIGMIGGIHQSKVLEENDLPGWDSTKNEYSARTGIHFGFIANLPFKTGSNLYFQPGIIFSNKGRKFAARYDTTVSQTLYVNSSEFINYIDIPLNLVYKFRLGKSASFMVGAGPYVSFFYTGRLKTETVAKNGDYTVDENKDPAVGNGPGKYAIMDYGANGLAGFEFGRVFLTANYSRGLKDFFKPDGYTGTFRHQVIGMTIGVFIDRLGKHEKAVKDRDGDGVPDDEDKCPDAAGLAKFKGCPDTDGDGIQDSEDKCPGEAGVAANGGCPYADKDKDGIPDKDDKCPDVFGVKENNGCPLAVVDTDKDGVPDSEDKCPTVPGLARYSGCPIPDTDGDGVNDEIDQCPNVKGTVARKGCPEEVKKEIVEKVNFAARRVQFAYGKANLLPASHKVLDQVVSILKQNPSLVLSVEGHTSSDAAFGANMKLSQQRADNVKAYLVSKGIAASRLIAIGYGPTRPISKGTSEAEKAKNRRVELKVSNQ
ncbi:MAG: OmpA family protein [Bacteroidota bacterium]|nr:OmpA family protein [Bacteroidota bacterium]